MSIVETVTQIVAEPNAASANADTGTNQSVVLPGQPFPDSEYRKELGRSLEQSQQSLPSTEVVQQGPQTPVSETVTISQESISAIPLTVPIQAPNTVSQFPASGIPFLQKSSDYSTLYLSESPLQPPAGLSAIPDETSVQDVTLPPVESSFRSCPIGETGAA